MKTLPKRLKVVEYNEKVKEFVTTFVCKQYSDRLLYELNSAKKHDKVIDRFAHESDKFLDRRYIKNKNSKYDIVQAEKDLKACGSSSSVLIFSGEKGLFELPLSEALLFAYNSYAPCVLICNSNLAFVKTESDGSADKILLFKE